MIFSITGISYLLLSFGLGVVAFRCFETWKRGNNRMAKLFSYFFIIFFLTTFVLGLTFLFSNKLNIIKGLLLFKDILFALGCGTLGYLIVHFKSSKFSPWWGFWPVFMAGILSLFIDLFYGHPFITKSGGINWGFPTIGYFLQFSLFLFTFLSMSVILFQQSKISQDSFLKTKAFLFSIVALGGFLVGFIELILEPFFNLEETYLNEIILILLNVTLFTFLLTSRQRFGVKT